MNGQQGGDPAQLAQALIELIGTGKPPLRWAAGADAVQALEQKARTLLDRPTLTGSSRPPFAHEDA